MMWGEEGEYNAASILPTVYVVDPLPTYTQFTTNWLKELSIMNIYYLTSISIHL